MYQDIAPHLPRLLVMPSPEELVKFQQAIDALEYLGIETEVATADILDHFRNRDMGLLNLDASGHDMCLDHQTTELFGDVERYVSARREYGRRLFDQLLQYGLFVNGMLHYQLRRLNPTMLVLEKLQIPLTDEQLRQRTLARQIDTASRRIISAFDARTAFPR